MNKKILVSLVCGLVGAVACNGGGGGGGSSGTFLPAGTYSTSFSNIQNNCQNIYFEGDSVTTSNGNGQICNPQSQGGKCFQMNLSNNPCLSDTGSLGGGSTGTQILTSCALTSTGMTAVTTITVSGNENCTATANVTMTKISSSTSTPNSIKNNVNSNNNVGFFSLEARK